MTKRIPRVTAPNGTSWKECAGPYQPAEVIPPPDARVENHGSVFLVQPLSEAADDWIRNNVQDGAQFFGGALAVEYRFVHALVRGMINDGLEVV